MAANNESISFIGDDQYKVIGFRSLSYVDIQSLMALYQPLVLGDALVLYLTLFSQISRFDDWEKHNDLTYLLNMDMNQLLNARHKLEQFGLLNTYFKKGINHDYYIYQLIHPLSSSEFLNNSVYARLLSNTIGLERFQKVTLSFAKEAVDTDGYQMINKTLDASCLQQWNSKDEQAFLQVKQNRITSSSTFDMQEFLNYCGTLALPVQCRSKEVLDVIEQASRLYGSTYQQLKDALYRSIRNNQFNKNTFIKQCEASMDQYRQDDNALSQSPAIVLKHYKQGINLTEAEKNLLSKLENEYHFSNEIINTIIEYVITHKKRFTKSYVESIASSIAYARLTNPKEIKLFLEGDNHKPAKGRKTTYVELVPDYQQNSDGDESVDQFELLNDLKNIEGNL